MLNFLIFLMLPAILTIFMRKFPMLKQFYQLVSCMIALYVGVAGAAFMGNFFSKILPESCDEWSIAAGAAVTALFLYALLSWLSHYIKEPELDFWQAPLISSVFTFFAHVFLFAFLLGLWCSTPAGAEGAYPISASVKKASESVLNGAFCIVDTFSMQSGTNRKERVIALKNFINPPKTEKRKLLEQQKNREFPRLAEQPIEFRAYADERTGNFVTVTKQIVPPLAPLQSPSAAAKSDQNNRGKDEEDSETDTE